MAAEDDYPFWDFMKPDVVWIVSRKQWTNASFRCNDFRGHFKEIE
ncbi:hypothetical protein UFOVP75_184 [uncultured Caudovirales phage]|uniref:Uncharacterized protein n=1 Tax=uncultured Caudovirales phage TaxID=2100421 RepID=A0A6J5L2I1_9CAUD|nr:hypothetical protein UFOVP75_184 [uncultured Caudovirales phage]